MPRPTSDLSLIGEVLPRPSLWQRLKEWYLNCGPSAAGLAQEDYEQLLTLLRQMALYSRDAGSHAGVCCIFGAGKDSIRVDSTLFLEAFAELAHQRRDLMLELRREERGRDAW